MQLCGNGREGLQVVRSWSPDLVLTDVMMPVLDGIEMCAEIKSDARTANTVVVLLTAQTHREAMLKGWEAKADEYLFKPFHPDELITRIRSLLAIVAERKAYMEWMEKKSSELARAEAELEQKEQLEMYARALERTNQQLEEFAIISAHDMKSPISTITGLLTLMEDRQAVKEPHAELFEMLKKSAGQTQKTIQALNEAVAFKKTLTIRREEVRFENILQDVRQSLAEPIMASEAVIRADFSRCAHIYFPPIHMKSIFQNLVSNAIKYAKDGEPPYIDISTRVEGHFIVLTVKDQGVGLNLELYRDRVFRLFQRFHTHKEGMGLGLYLVYSIVEAYGGKIDVESEVGLGTKFTIYLSNADGE
ncbi:ATP-binding protein [Puia sp. P3]|uniref:ATP-binding protein n=1 Tax=Puia sp. P3 TaxID=3423952 RepID=UPI003D670CF9